MMEITFSNSFFGLFNSMSVRFVLIRRYIQQIVTLEKLIMINILSNRKLNDLIVT